MAGYQKRNAKRASRRVKRSKLTKAQKSAVLVAAAQTVAAGARSRMPRSHRESILLFADSVRKAARWEDPDELLDDGLRDGERLDVRRLVAAYASNPSLADTKAAQIRAWLDESNARMAIVDAILADLETTRR